MKCIRRVSCSTTHMSEALSIEFEPHFDNHHPHPHNNNSHSHPHPHNNNSHPHPHRSDGAIVPKNNKMTIYGTNVRKEFSKHFVLSTVTYEIEEILTYDNNKTKRKKENVIIDSDDEEIVKKSRHEKLLIEKEKENLRIVNQNNTHINVSLDAIKKAYDAPIELLAIAPVVISEDDLLVINDYQGMY